ncbi:hypothetical protein HPP92_017415, partial [Vanilla planifolia]
NARKDGFKKKVEVKPTLEKKVYEIEDIKRIGLENDKRNYEYNIKESQFHVKLPKEYYSKKSEEIVSKTAKLPEMIQKEDLIRDPLKERKKIQSHEFTGQIKQGQQSDLNERGRPEILPLSPIRRSDIIVVCLSSSRSEQRR